MSDKRRTILSLRAVAALAEKLADDMERNRLWPGDAAATIDEISRNLQDAEREPSR